MTKLIVVTYVLLGGLAVAGSAFAQHVPAEPVARSQATGQSWPATPPVAQVVKPGDRSCLQQTGSLIRAKKGTCLPVAGRSYSADDLQRMGTPNTARALQMLDPSVSVGH